MAWSSFSRRNQILTLRTKLRNAAMMKKYLLLAFMFFLGGLGLKLHERFLMCESVSRMLCMPRFGLRMPDMQKNEYRLSLEPRRPLRVRRWKGSRDLPDDHPPKRSAAEGAPKDRSARRGRRAHRPRPRGGSGRDDQGSGVGGRSPSTGASARKNRPDRPTRSAGRRTRSPARAAAMSSASSQAKRLVGANELQANMRMPNAHTTELSVSAAPECRNAPWTAATRR